MQMDTKILQNDIDTGQLKPVYLLYGEERFLVSHYTDALAQHCERDVFEGNQDVQQIILAADMLPFLGEKRAVIIRDSRLCTTGRKDDTEALAAYIPNIPEESMLIFAETDIHKANRLYKKIAELGRAVECTTPAPPVLIKWLTQKCRAKNKSINPTAAEQLMRVTAHNMTALLNEIDKLAAYAGNRPSITTEDIDALCTSTLQTRIFDLLAAMGRGHVGNALTLYQNMLHMKESPLMILTMLIRQFRILLLCKSAQENKVPRADMAKAFGLRSFMIEEALTQARRYSMEKLIAALTDCQETDVRIKTGRIEADIGVELIIVGYTIA